MKKNTSLLKVFAAIALLMFLASCGLFPGGNGPNLPPQQPPTQEPGPPPPTQSGSPNAPPQPTPQPTTQPTQEIQITPGPPFGAYAYGYDETILVNQCFDLVDGDLANCTDTAADIKFTFAPGQGGYILPLHEYEHSAGMGSQPNKATCEASSFLTLPLEMLLPSETSTGDYYCFITQRGLMIYYGWLQPVSFDAGGLTFNFVTFEPTSAAATGRLTAIPNTILLVLSQGTGQTMTLNQCFSLALGETTPCRGPVPDFQFTQPAHYALEGLNSTLLGYPDDSGAPTKSDCQSQTSMQITQTLLSGMEGAYFCFSAEYDGDTIYGWIRPTAFDTSGLTFDWKTYLP
jgi:hypothetical protein